MKNKIYITGHKNPDTDSICSAIALAELKTKMGEDAEAIRLGNLNKETEFVLKHFGVQKPRLKTSIKPQVRDIEIFMEKGYKVEKYQTFDQFPRSRHVEAVALIQKM